MAKRRRTALDEYIDPDLIDAYLENDPDIVAGKVELATAAQQYARSIAPVDEGDYKDGIVVRRRGRTGVSLEFTDPKSNLIEYGTVETPEFAVRARTAEHFGGTLGEE